MWLSFHQHLEVIQVSLQKEKSIECNQITNLLRVTVNPSGETLI